MKILFTRFPLESIPHGGAETQVLHLAKGLAARKHAVAFVGSCEALMPAFEEAGLLTAELDIGPPPVSKLHVATFPIRKKKMRQKLEEMLSAFGKLDVLFMLSLSEKLLLTELAVKKGIQVIWIEHDPIGPWLTRNPSNKELLKLSKLVTTVTVSDLGREDYLELGWDRSKTVAIPNGIDDAWFKEEPATVRDDTKGLHVGCVARLAEEKGIDLLLKAIAGMPGTLDIVGKGPEESALKKRVERAELHHRVRFFDRRDDLATFYRTLDILVLPSRSDPFGMVVAEAMAIGVPCVVTEACGIAGYLNDGEDAVIVKAESVEVLRKGIESLEKQDARRKISERARKTAQERFRVERMVDEYEKIIKV